MKRIVRTSSKTVEPNIHYLSTNLYSNGDIGNYYVTGFVTEERRKHFGLDRGRCFSTVARDFVRIHLSNERYTQYL